MRALESLYSVVKALEATSSRLEKEAILRAVDGPLQLELKKLLQYAYEPTIKFYLRSSSIPDLASPPERHYELIEALDETLQIVVQSNRGLTNIEKQAVAQIRNGLSPENRTLFDRVIDRDLKCGINVSTINKVFPGLISVVDFMLADTDVDAIRYPAISQLKEDGTRVCIISGAVGQVIAMTRNGSEVMLPQTIIDSVIACTSPGDFLDGELVCFDENNIRLPRKISNGIINKVLKGTANDEEMASVRYVAWDLVRRSEQKPYAQRFEDLQRAVQLPGVHGRLMVVLSRTVNSREEAIEHFKECRRLGFEGTILKNADALWQPKRSKDLCKFKAEIDVDLRIVGIELGTGRNENRVGAIWVEDADQKIYTKVGIFKDMPESVRDTLLTEHPIVTVRYNERITSKSKDKESLFLPRVIALRYDKNEPNTYEEILAAERNALGED